MGTLVACCKEIIQSTAEAIFLSEGIPNLMPQQHPPALCPIEKLDMVNTFSGTEQCRSIAQADKQGFLQVTNNGVTWKVFVSQGKLRYAHHSVQTLDIFNYHLAQLGHEAVTQLAADMDSMNLASWGTLNATIDHLGQQGKLDVAAQTKLKNAIAKSNLETLLWLPACEPEWHDLHQSPSAGYRYRKPIEVAFTFYDSQHQPWCQVDPCGLTMNTFQNSDPLVRVFDAPTADAR